MFKVTMNLDPLELDLLFILELQSGSDLLS
jgi:hypothetical protein